MNPRMTPRRAAVATALLAVLVHLGALTNGFAYDDNTLILGDEGIRQFSGLLGRLMEPSWPAAFGEQIGAWRPVTTATWAVTYIVSNGSPVAFHALGVLVHAVVTGLGVLMLAEVIPLTMAAASGVLFAVHPVHVEAVANVAGTAEPISALFAVIALLLHVRGGRSYGPGRIVAVTVAFALAFLAKEGAVIVPILFVLLDGARWDVRVRDVTTYIRDRWALYTVLTLTLSVLLLMRLDVVGAIAAASHPAGGEVLRSAPRGWTVFSTWPHVFRLLIVPLDLAADYGTAVIPIVFRWSANALLGVVLGLAAFGGAGMLWRRGDPLRIDAPSERLPGLAILWIAACLLPVANVLFLAPVLIAERTFYMASWGAAMFAGWIVVSLAERNGPRAYGLLIALTLAGTARTVTRVPDWDGDDALMQTLLEGHPESGGAWMYLGRQLAARGRSDEALRAFSYGIDLLNSEYRPATDVAAHLVAMGRPASAAFFLRRAWKEHPEWYTAPGLLAAAELNLGRPEKAAPAARAAVFLDPENASMHHLLAQSMAGLGNWEAAVTARRASLDAGFSDRARSWLLLAQELLNVGDSEAATRALDSAESLPLTDSERTVLLNLRAAIELGGND